jgi:hypothetical protein
MSKNLLSLVACSNSGQHIRFPRRLLHKRCTNVENGRILSLHLPNSRIPTDSLSVMVLVTKPNVFIVAFIVSACKKNEKNLLWLE